MKKYGTHSKIEWLAKLQHGWLLTAWNYYQVVERSIVWIVHCSILQNLQMVLNLIVGGFNKERRHVKLKDMKKNIAVGPSMKYMFWVTWIHKQQGQEARLHQCVFYTFLLCHNIFPHSFQHSVHWSDHICLQTMTHLCQLLFLWSHCIHQLCGLKEVGQPSKGGLLMSFWVSN